MEIKRLNVLIKEKRLQLKLSLKALSELAQCSCAYLSDIENNKRVPIEGKKFKKILSILRFT